MLGTVADKLDSWLGRSFVLSVYVPCLMFTILNAFLAAIDRPAVREFLLSEYSGVASTKATDFLCLLLVVAVVAFALSPLVRFVTQLLEGENLPAFVAEPLLVFEAQRRESFAEHGRAVERRRLPLPTKEYAAGLLRDARAVGASSKRVSNDASITEAAARVDELRIYRLLNRPIDMGTFNAALEAVVRALRENCAEPQDLRVPVTTEDANASMLLDGIHIEMDGILIPYVIDIAERTDASAWKKRSRRFAETELLPTRLGNEVAELRSYCDSRYGMDFDFFWPHLQIVLQEDEKLITAIVRAKIQVDFSIVSLALTVLSGGGWLANAILFGCTPATLLIVVSVTPPMLWGWQMVARASYSDFSQLVRSAIDLNRRKVLAKLSIEAPATLETERETWHTIGHWLILNDTDGDLPFDKGTSSAKA